MQSTRTQLRVVPLDRLRYSSFAANTRSCTRFATYPGRSGTNRLHQLVARIGTVVVSRARKGSRGRTHPCQSLSPRHLHSPALSRSASLFALLLYALSPPSTLCLVVGLYFFFGFVCCGVFILSVIFYCRFRPEIGSAGVLVFGLSALSESRIR